MTRQTLSLERKTACRYSIPMTNIKRKLLFLGMLLCAARLFAQEFGMGAILDPVRYEQTDAKPVLLTRNYNSVPSAFSLKQYSPVPESQGQYGTCVGWSTAFAARTISESVALGRTDRTATSNNVFSPTHVYKSISDNEGKNGANIGIALMFMKETGIVKRPAIEKSMYLANNFRNISLSLFNTLRRYPISGHVRLFANYGPGTVNEKVAPVKKSLSEGKPVLIGMPCPNSFKDAWGKELWETEFSEKPENTKGGHAMCVIGYDDNKYGGAFEFQNSWGTEWGNGGYIWVRYEDFAAWVGEAYEVIENLANFREMTKFEASIDIVVFNDSRGMPVTYNREGYYKTRYTYPEGTRFQFQMTNKQAAYVYAFSVDNTSAVLERVFPSPGVSPVLDYKDSTIAWPSEFESMELSGPAKTDYLIVLYSKEALDIGSIERRFADESGNFTRRVERAVGENFIPYNAVQFNGTKIEFSAQKQNPKAVLGLLLAIERK